MTQYEKSGAKYSKGQPLKVWDEDSKKWVNGIVEEVGDETIYIQWEDLSEGTEYSIEDVELQGDVFYESKQSR